MKKINTLTILNHLTILNQIFYYVLLRDSVVLLSVLPFYDGLSLLKEIGVSVTFILIVLERFTLDLSGVFELTTKLELTVPERM